MRKLRGLLLSIALVLPLAAIGASDDIKATVGSAAAGTTVPGVVSEPEAQEVGCCWVFYFGRWWCIYCPV